MTDYLESSISILEVSTSVEASPIWSWGNNREQESSKVELLVEDNKRLDFGSYTLEFLPNSRVILHHFSSNLFLQFLNKITHKFYERI